jgi:hypothetical protein
LAGLAGLVVPLRADLESLCCQAYASGNDEKHRAEHALSRFVVQKRQGIVRAPKEKLATSPSQMP